MFFKSVHILYCHFIAAVKHGKQETKAQQFPCHKIHNLITNSLFQIRQADKILS